MRNLFLPLLIIISGCQPEAPPAAADVILTNAYVYTVDSNRSVADSIAIRGNRIAAVGDAATIMELAGPDTDVRDLDGKMVLPGLHDMHIHAMGSVQPDRCDFGEEPLDLDELVEFLRACLDISTPGAWLAAIGWNPYAGNQPTEQYPTIRAALDAVSTEHPIILWAFDAHHGAANSLALASARVPITAETLRTDYAHIRPLVEVDENGEPTGGINEEARLMLRDMDDDFLGVAADSEGVMPQLAEGLARSGITSIQDPAGTAAILEHYLWLARSGGMTFRMRTALRLDLYDPATARVTRTPAEVVAEASALRASAQGHPYLSTDAVKIFADDVLEGDPYSIPPVLPNAAMIDGFRRPHFEIDEDTGIADVVGYGPADAYAPGYAGELVHEPGVLNELVALATAAGFHVHVHTIADASVRAIADAFELAHDDARSKGLTQSIAHLQIARTDDVHRLGQLGAFVAFTFMWANADPAYEMVVIPFIDEVAGIDDLYNPEHYYVRNAYPFRTALEAGALPVFGSDVPVGSRNPRPFRNMQAALTRESDGVVLNAGETLDIHETIAAFTINGARLMTHDDELGSLETSKIADLIVIDRNIVELAEAGNGAAVGQTNVLMTMFDGRIIFEAESPR